MAVLRLTNTIRRYDWGSTEAIPRLLGVPPDGRPQAELWIGAHPDSPSTVPDGRGLDQVIEAEAEVVLGPHVRAAFGDRLPFLTKILAAAAPLSLQVHPDADQAAAGFAAEEAAGVPRDARERRYKDPFHKPEMVIALSPFQALCGWREVAGTRALLAALDVAHPDWATLVQLLADGQGADALARAVAWLLGGDLDVQGVVSQVGEAARRRTDVPALQTVAGLADIFPGDPGVVVSLLLNRVTLAPGEALYLPAGNVHAYLHGIAIEVMAASDNVLRAGLTPKHVDVAELLRTVDWAPRPVPTVVSVKEGLWRRYEPGAAEFAAHLADLDAVSDPWHDAPAAGPRVVLALGGPIEVRTEGSTARLGGGDTVLVPDVDGPLQVRGTGTAVVVCVPCA